MTTAFEKHVRTGFLRFVLPNVAARFDELTRHPAWPALARFEGGEAELSEDCTLILKWAREDGTLFRLHIDTVDRWSRWDFIAGDVDEDGSLATLGDGVALLLSART